MGGLALPQLSDLQLVTVPVLVPWGLGALLPVPYLEGVRPGVHCLLASTAPEVPARPRGAETHPWQAGRAGILKEFRQPPSEMDC